MNVYNDGSDDTSGLVPGCDQRYEDHHPKSRLELCRSSYTLLSSGDVRSEKFGVQKEIQIDFRGFPAYICKFLEIFTVCDANWQD